MSGDPLEQFKATFFEECSELLADSESRLGGIRLSDGPVDIEDLNAIFRAIHSVKGGAGAFEFTDLIGFAHVFETVLDKLRNHEAETTEHVIDTMIACNDHLISLVDAARDETVTDDAVTQRLKAALNALIDGGQPAAAENLHEHVSEGVELPVPPHGNRRYKISFIPHPELFKYANEPLLLLRELAGLGTAEIVVDTSKLPTIEALDPDLSYLSWTINLLADCSEDDIREVFEFVEDDCDLTIALDEVGDAAAAQAEDAPEEPPASEPTPPDESDTGKEPAQQNVPTPAVAAAAATAPAGNKPVQAKPGGGGAQSGTVGSIRVELDRVDRLVNMVGELVITQAMLKQRIGELPADMSTGLSQGFDDLVMHTRELQESVMAVRMQPVNSVFARMPRLVRDLAAKLDKKVQLVMTGEMTEVDKTVIEQLADPLTHMIRNSLDHGIETAAERTDSGKPETATIHLIAEHRGGRIEIRVSDDGRGINRQRVQEKAIEKGVISRDDNLTDEQIDELIFAPGFSTADAVTDVSGRGVGMDVVRRNIIGLGGRISVRSEPDRGTQFTLSLPLTLAVLDGMVVAVADEKYIIPLTSIVESIRPSKKQLNRLSNGADVVSVRGNYIRLIRLYHLFGIPQATQEPDKGIVVIVEIEGGELVGVLVDDLLGQQQVVIKSLEHNYDPVSGISAATILGNGRVALILDIDGLNMMAQSKNNGSRNTNQTLAIAPPALAIAGAEKPTDHGNMEVKDGA
ncbi:chemotaxis protein CheA [Hwanghaeella grinnelliae]|uniref:Chemotaxis protein CheA n=1 Tax=Hwanghaeella grinnelliae TaxID=2500179 RepID=A0A3S2WSY6_9PROT|nr:chemotaxis protein CheA [Hwanghaeella grinnelliae]RVU37768.1 chemotaxis protein CheA [Hwanghaeella grinnelliae]